jgi:hypothetical protein
MTALEPHQLGTVGLGKVTWYIVISRLPPFLQDVNERLP